MPTTAIIACGALAREITELIRLNNWQHMKMHCLPANCHNAPERITPAVEAKIHSLRDAGYTRVFVAYGDCGTGGRLDELLEREQVERLPGPHCYSFFAGASAFDALHEEALGSFYLTDFLVRHFERLILREMGIEKHPELAAMYFGNYTRLVYLAQTDNPELQSLARTAAERLGLDYHYQLTGYGEMASSLRQVACHNPNPNPEPIEWHA